MGSPSWTTMKGFSLLEIIIAISLLAVGIAGAVALISRTISVGSVVRNQLVAWHLAQEGMEVVYNIRNTNWTEQSAWDDGLVDGNSCVDFDSTSFINPCDGASRNLYILSNRYEHNPGGAATGFSRHIEISDGVDGGGASFKLAKSIVEWPGGSATAEERLYDWK